MTTVLRFVRVVVASIFLSAALCNADEVDESESVTFQDLFSRAAIRDIALSPSGELIAYFRFNTLVVGKPREGFTDVRNFADRLNIRDITWIGSDTVWVESWDERNKQFLSTAVRFARDDEERWVVDAVEDHWDNDILVDNLADDNSQIILAESRWEDELLAADLYRVNVFEPLEDQKKRRNRIDTGSDEFFYYETNANGEYVLGVRLAEGLPEIYRRLPGADEWEHVWTSDRESSFVPIAMSDDASMLWVLTDTETDRVVAAEFDLETKSFGDILFEHDRVDVDSIVMSSDTNVPVGVRYTEQGLVQYHFLSAEIDADFEQIRAQFPEKGVIRIGYASQTGRMLVFVASPNERGEIHVCDVREDWCEHVESVAPWLSGKKLNSTIAFDVQSTDGLIIESFLTLPADPGSDKIPLITMPHGGPIGISDERYFSGEVQWFAQNGYAVLQVNYRGSGGYGQEFQNAGLRQWGRGIEDDIEAAVKKAIADHPIIDANRIGIFGASYGGYSAMMSVIRNPELFKCAASFAGVMDLTLLFTESTAVQRDYLRDVLIKYVGDPNIDYTEQREHSPVYRYKDIKRPIFLAHGLDDTVADFEHTWRMQKMLRLAGSPPKLVFLKDVGHGFDYVSEAKKLYDPLLAFLDEHLKMTTE